MAQQFANINLIGQKAKGSAHLAVFEQSLRKSAIISVSVFFSCVVILGVSYFIFASLQKQEDVKRQAFFSRINAAKNKEGLLASIKDRTQIITGVLAVQRPWANVLDMLAGIINPSKLTNISADENNRISIGFSVASLDEAAEPIHQLITLATAGKIKNPELVSVQFNPDGAVVVTVSFITTFTL